MPRPSSKVDKSVSIVSKTMQGLGTRLNVLETFPQYNNTHRKPFFVYTFVISGDSAAFLTIRYDSILKDEFCSCCKLYVNPQHLHRGGGGGGRGGGEFHGKLYYLSYNLCPG